MQAQRRDVRKSSTGPSTGLGRCQRVWLYLGDTRFIDVGQTYNWWTCSKNKDSGHIQSIPGIYEVYGNLKGLPGTTMELLFPEAMIIVGIRLSTFILWCSVLFYVFTVYMVNFSSAQAGKPIFFFFLDPMLLKLKFITYSLYDFILMSKTVIEHYLEQVGPHFST